MTDHLKLADEAAATVHDTDADHYSHMVRLEQAVRELDRMLRLRTTDFEKAIEERDEARAENKKLRKVAEAANMWEFWLVRRCAACDDHIASVPCTCSESARTEQALINALAALKRAKPGQSPEGDQPGPAHEAATVCAGGTEDEDSV